MWHQSAAESGDEEPLHQLRVAARRLRASIELFASVIYAAQLKLYRRDLPWVGAQAGAVRECDVTAALIGVRAAKIDPDLKDAIAPMVEALGDRRKSEHAKLYALLASKRYRGLIAKLSHPAIKKIGADRMLGPVAAQLIRPATHSAARLGRKLHADAPAIVFHKLRVRIKRLRYESRWSLPSAPGATKRPWRGSKRSRSCSDFFTTPRWRTPGCCRMPRHPPRRPGPYSRPAR